MRYALIGPTLVAVLTIACGWAQSATAQVAAPAPLRSGTYPLQAYNGKPLPTDLSLVLPKVPPGVVPDSFGACVKLVTGGTLTLDLEGRRFSLAYDVWSPCDRAFLPKVNLSGQIEQRGDDLVFQVGRQDRIETFRGSVGLNTITLNVGRPRPTFEFRAR